MPTLASPRVPFQTTTGDRLSGVIVNLVDLQCVSACEFMSF